MPHNNDTGYQQRVGKAFDIKTKVFAALSLIISAAFALGNLISAIVYKSIWFASLSAYYTTMLVFRAAVLISNVAGAVKNRGNAEKLYKWKIYLAGGLILLLTGLAMSAAIGQLVLGSKPQTGFVITLATGVYTVYKVVTAIVNAVKAGRYADPVTQSLRNLNVADACMSVVSLVAALLATFGEGGTPTRITVAAVGGTVILTVLVMSIVMIARAAVNIRQNK